jgi:Tfp pilus assembly protein PilF
MNTRILLSLLFLVFFQPASFAQSGKTPATKNPASGKELDEQLKAAQKSMENLTPEQKKMMEQIGIPTQPINAVPANTSDQQIKQATGDSYVPVKNAALIAGIPKTPLTSATLPAYVRTMDDFVMKNLNENAKTLGQKIYAQLQSDGQSASAIGNSAAVLWASGRVETAMYLADKVAKNSPDNSNNLNNFAAMLVMGGIPQTAIPVLNYLDTKFPGNSTILNNIGQAWFALGDLQLAEKYLKEVIRIYAYHPQANFTQSFIEEKKGNSAEAVEMVKKSVKNNYSLEKENRLRKLGYKLKSDDVNFPFKPDPDPLGLNAFNHPETAKSVDEELASLETWKSFNNNIFDAVTQKTNEQNQLQDPKKQLMMANAQKHMDGQHIEVEDVQQPPFYKKAALKLKALDNDGGINFRYKKAETDLKQYIKTIIAAKTAYETEAQNLKKIYDGREGGGWDIDCNALIALQSKYLNQYNTRFDELLKDYLHQTRLKLNEEVYWKQFMQSDADYEITKLSYQQQWLSALSKANSRLAINGENQVYECLTASESKGSQKLAEFNDIVCNYHSELDWEILKMKMNCNKWETEFDAKIIKIGLKQDMDKETFADQFVSCTLEIEKSIGEEVKLGPAEIGVEVGAGIGIEIDRKGVQDVYITGKVEASAGASMGGEAKVSLISGKSSAGGSGIFKQE